MRRSRVYTTEAIIIKRKNIGEADRIVTMLTRYHGKIRAIAKGVRKVPSRRAGHLEVFSSARVSLYRRKSLDIITEAVSTDHVKFDRNDLSRVSLGYYICELIDTLIPEEDESVSEMYDVFVHTTNSLAHITEKNSQNELVEAFALELLWRLGFLPRSQTLTRDAVDPFVEGIIERKLKTREVLTRLNI